jgi:hypothetical protein
MVANNIKALKRLGVSEKLPFFRFYDKKKLKPCFGPLRLHKCTRNLFLKRDVANVECEITVSGWQLQSGMTY